MEYERALGLAEEMAATLAATRERLDAIPGEYLDADAAGRGKLAKEKVALDAQERLEVALLCELRRRQVAILVAAHRQALAEAEAEYAAYNRDVWKPARAELERALEMNRRAMNNPDGIPELAGLGKKERRAKMAEIRAAAEKAKAEMSLSIGPQRHALGDRVAKARRVVEDDNLPW